MIFLWGDIPQTWHPLWSEIVRRLPLQKTKKVLLFYFLIKPIEVSTLENAGKFLCVLMFRYFFWDLTCLVTESSILNSLRVWIWFCRYENRFDSCYQIPPCVKMLCMKFCSDLGACAFFLHLKDQQPVVPHKILHVASNMAIIQLQYKCS